MEELQFLNLLIKSKDYTVITYNEIDETYFEVYKKHFKFIKEHYEKYGNIPDMETVVEQFNDFYVVDVNEGFDFLVLKLKENYMLRSLVPHINKIQELVISGDADKAWDYWVAVGESREFIKKTEVVDLVDNAKDRFEEYLVKSRNIGQFYKRTGLKELDEIIHGWDAKEDFVLLAARTNIGKTWWLILFALYQAKQGEVVGFVSMEMGANKIGVRMDTFATHLSNFGLSKADIELQVDYEKYIKNIKQEIPGNFKVLTSENITGNFTVSKIKSFVEKEKITILFADQFNLLTDDKNSKSNTEAYINISRDLKQLQTKLRIPIIVAAQLNRSANEKDEDTPGTKNIAGTDRVAQDATTILFLWKKDEHYVLMVGKHREARVGDKLHYAWDIDKGELVYIPVGTDPIQRKIKRETEKEISQTARTRKEDVFS